MSRSTNNSSSSIGTAGSGDGHPPPQQQQQQQLLSSSSRSRDRPPVSTSASSAAAAATPPPPPSSLDHSVREPPGKRRRISLACQACRTRKSRCDGARPKCSYCEDLNFDCVYLQSASSSNVIIGKEYLGSLEERLRLAEDDIKQLKTSQARPLRQLRFDDDDQQQQQQRRLGEDRNETPERLRPGKQRNGGGMEVNSDDLQDFSGLEDETDGMGAVVFSAEQDCGFFGPSSNIAFTRHISRAVAQVTNINQSWFTAGNNVEFGRFDTGVMSVSQPGSPSGRLQSKRKSRGSDRNSINIYALPPEGRARELISQYFSNTGLLFPYIHAGTFMETYEEMKRNNFTKVRRTWLGLLNIVLALSTSTSVHEDMSAEKRARDSDVYYQRALGLCDKLIMRGTSVEIVQYLLVMGKYLQGTQKSVETWTIHGLAVKAAMQLGLHSAEASRRFSPLDQEIRKRIWYGCVILDRTLSMTFGRPAAIPDDYVKLELPRRLDDGGSSPGMAADPRSLVSVEFFNATIMLYKIMWNVISLCYGGNIGCDPQMSVFETVSRLFQMEQQLIDWKRQLPPALTLRQSIDFLAVSSPHDPILSSMERFPVILTLRYHNLRVLLHRPVLVKFFDTTGTTGMGLDTQELSLLQQVGSNSVQICVQSAMEIIGLVSTLVASTGLRRAWLGAWWYSLYYTYNAALVIFAALLIMQDQDMNGSVVPFLPVPQQELQKCLNDAMVALRQLGNQNRMVERCANYLGQLTSVLEALTTSTSSVPDLTNGTAPDTSHFNSQTHYHGEASHGNFNPMSFSNSIISNASPLGMELGEFMLEDDIEFLNQLASTGILTSMNKTPMAPVVSVVSARDGPVENHGMNVA